MAEMQNTEVTFLSIVKNPATRKRFQVFKSAQEERGTLMGKLGQAISEFFVTRSAAPAPVEQITREEEIVSNNGASVEIAETVPVTKDTDAVLAALGSPGNPISIVSPHDRPQTFAECMQRDKWYDEGWQLVDTLSCCLSDIFWSRSVTDKAAAIRTTVADFQDAMLKILQVTRSEGLEDVAKSFKVEIMREGRQISTANSAKIEACLNKLAECQAELQGLKEAGTPATPIEGMVMKQEDDMGLKEDLAELVTVTKSISDRMEKVETALVVKNDNPPAKLPTDHTVPVAITTGLESPSEGDKLKCACCGDIHEGPNGAGKLPTDHKIATPADAKTELETPTEGQAIAAATDVHKSADPVVTPAPEVTPVAKSDPDVIGAVEVLKSAQDNIASQVAEVATVLKSVSERLGTLDELAERLETVERSSGMPKGGDGNGAPVQKSGENSSVFAGSAFGF